MKNKISMTKMPKSMTIKIGFSQISRTSRPGTSKFKFPKLFRFLRHVTVRPRTNPAETKIYKCLTSKISQLCF
jgi:hypothetical protein